MAKFLVHGGYFSRNYGDFVLIDKTIKTIKNINPTASVGLAMAPSFVRDEFKESIDDITIMNIFSVDKVLFTGGGYLGERDYKVLKWSILCLYRQIILPMLCILLNKPYAYFGVEVGPLRYKFIRKLVGFVLDRSTFVLVRNDFSNNFCHSIMNNKEKIILTTDFAQNKDFLKLYQSKITKLSKEEKYIGIHVTKYNHQYDKFFSAIEDTIKNFERDGFKLVFFTDSPSHDHLIGDDSFFFKKLFDKENHVFIPYQGPESTTCLLGMLSAVITSKLHVGIVGITLGCIPLSLPSHNKTIHYYNQIGHSKLCLYRASVDCVDLSLEYFVDLVYQQKKLGRDFNLIPENNLESEKFINSKILDFINN